MPTWRVNDSPYLIPLLEGEEKIEEVYADKGYDSLRNIRFVLSKGGKPYIAIRENASRGLRRRLLKLSKSQEWVEKYSHRNVVESVFHSFKRVMGDYILAHSFSSASKLLLFKVLAYDLYAYFFTRFLFPLFHVLQGIQLTHGERTSLKKIEFENKRNS